MLSHSGVSRIMRTKRLMVAGFTLAMCGAGLVGCKKANGGAAVADRHSPEAVMQTMMEQATVLDEGVKRKDFAKVDEQAYYLQGVAKALYASLAPEQQGRLDGLFNEVTRTAEELDHAAGRRHEEATVA